MERRKFLIGAGSLAAGSAAAVGTGAFTSVEADRTVDIAVAGDNSALLGLAKVSSSSNKQYVEKSNKELSFDFSAKDDDGSSVTGGGDGFNANAVTEIDNLLKVTNQGTQEVEFWVDLTDFNVGGGGSLNPTNYVTIEATETEGSEDGQLSSQVADAGSNTSNVTTVTLTTGESIYLHLVADVPDQSPDAFSGTVTFVADESGLSGASSD